MKKRGRKAKAIAAVVAGTDSFSPSVPATPIQQPHKHHHHKTDSNKKKEDQFKREISRKLFLASFLIGAIAFIGDSIFGPKVSAHAWDFLVYFIGIFTVNYTVRRGTDTWGLSRGVNPPSYYTPYTPAQTDPYVADSSIQNGMGVPPSKQGE